MMLFSQMLLKKRKHCRNSLKVFILLITNIKYYKLEGKKPVSMRYFKWTGGSAFGKTKA